VRFHVATQNDLNLKLFNCFCNFPFNCFRPQVTKNTETESQTTDWGWRGTLEIGIEMKRLTTGLGSCLQIFAVQSCRNSYAYDVKREKNKNQ
jgi:hypothetical protein